MGFMDTHFEMESLAISKESNNGDSTILNPDKIFITPHLNKQLWKLRIDKMVKAAKDVATSHWAVPILLLLLLGYWVYSDQKSNARTASLEAVVQKQVEEQAKQRDLLVRLDQQNQDLQKEKEKEQQRRDQIDRENAMWRETMNVKMAALSK